MSARFFLASLLGLVLAAPPSAQDAPPTPEPAPNTTRLFVQGSLGVLSVGAPVVGNESSATFGFGRGLAVGYGITPRVTLFGGFDFVGFIPPHAMEPDDSVLGSSLSSATGALLAGVRLNFPSAGDRVVPYGDLGVALVGTAYLYRSGAFDRPGSGDGTADRTYGGVGAFGGLGLQIAVTPEVMIRAGGEVLATRYTVADFDGDSETLDDPTSSLTGGLRVGVVAYPFR